MLAVAWNLLHSLSCVSIVICHLRIACNVQYVYGNTEKLIEDRNFWNGVASEELETSLRLEWNSGVAKNVVLFVGDGMGPNTVTATRIYKSGEQGKLAFENFPHIALLKTYCLDKQVPDSASTATALFSGVKGNYKTSGVDATVKRFDCEASLNPDARLKSILDWAQEAGKDTGFVTTTRVTHATPSALYAHSADRSWECEDRMPTGTERCKDIARQLVEDQPGRDIKVIFGGGRQCMSTNASARPGDPIDTWACSRKDGRELVEEWQQDKRARHLSHAVVTNTGELHALDVAKTDYVLGIFANGHMNYDRTRDRSASGMPSLQEMTSTAIKILRKNSNGFVLVVEGGMIDFAHHRGLARRALDETLGLEVAVEEALNYAEESRDAVTKLSDTLIIVTSDHTHTLSINGYPDRGTNITGIASRSKADDVPYTTLTYATGEVVAYQTSSNRVVRTDPTDSDYSGYDYQQQATIVTNEATHGGGDVAVYATGPMSHLFHSVHEQNYVAHVAAFASKIGPYRSNHVDNKGSIHQHTSTTVSIVLLAPFAVQYMPFG